MSLTGETFVLDVHGVKVPLSIPFPAHRPSTFVFSLHKAGSSLLQSVVMQLATTARLPLIDILGACFAVGALEDMLEADQIRPIVMRDGFIFSLFRRIGPLPLEALEGRRKVLLIRDPRDMFVSLYFSLRYSHRVASKGPSRVEMVKARDTLSNIEINEFVLSDYVEFLTRNFREYLAVVNSSWRVYRYEDIIFDKLHWIDNLAGYLDVEIENYRRAEIAKSVDIFPNTEDVYSHVRQVLPGNYRKYLSAATIDELNDRLVDILSRFGYA